MTKDEIVAFTKETARRTKANEAGVPIVSARKHRKRLQQLKDQAAAKALAKGASKKDRGFSVA